MPTTDISNAMAPSFYTSVEAMTGSPVEVLCAGSAARPSQTGHAGPSPLPPNETSLEASTPPLSPRALQNIRLMHLLERIALRFNAAGVPLMTLKGAALQLTLYREPDERAMADIDLLVRPADLEEAIRILEGVGGLRSEPLFREDFFPRFYYEIQFRIGSVHPVTVDLHVRSLRPLRLARIMPDDALWPRAIPVDLGAATVLVPAEDEMLIHLAAHCAFHGNNDDRWLEDIRRWIHEHGPGLDWDRVLETLDTWHLVAAFRSAIDATETKHGAVLPTWVRTQLDGRRSNWRDRLALWHAPRDQVHMTGSALANALTVKGWRFRLAYLRQVLLPDRAYMDAWSDRHQCRWRALAVLARSLRPVFDRLPFLRPPADIEVRKSGIHGYGVYAKRVFEPGMVIARYRGRPIDRDGTYVAYHTGEDEAMCRHEITGPLRFLNHYCRANAELVEFELIARQTIPEGAEITIDYGEDGCECDRTASG